MTKHTEGGFVQDCGGDDPIWSEEAGALAFADSDSDSDLDVDVLESTPAAPATPHVGTWICHSLPLKRFKQQNTQEVTKVIVQGFR